MPDLADNLRSASTQISELGSLESGLSVDLTAQATKFDEAWSTIDANPDKSLKALSEQVTKLTTEANLNDNDRAKDTARNFSTDIQELTRLRQELNAAKGRKDQKSVERLQGEYNTANYRARNTYEYWRRGDAEQYKIQKETLKKKQKQAADEVQRAIDALDKDIGSEGNEQFTQLRAALQTVQTSLTSGKNTSGISLPGASKFDPKKGDFSSYFENWKRRNKIDETDLRKPKNTKDKADTTDEEPDEISEERNRRREQRTEAKKRSEAATIQAKASTIAAIASGALAGAATVGATSNKVVNAPTEKKQPETKKAVDEDKVLRRARRQALLEYGESAGLIQLSGKENAQEREKIAASFETDIETKRAELIRRGSRSAWSADDILRYTADPNEERRQDNLERFIQIERKLDPSAIAFLQKQRDQVPKTATVRFTSSAVTAPETNLQRQYDAAIRNSAKLWQEFPDSGITTVQSTQEIIFTGKIGRRLEKNVAEFEQVKQRIIQIQAKIQTQTVPDADLVQELNIHIEQAIQIQQGLIGDAKIQIEATLEQSPDQAAAVAAALVASVAGAVNFTTLSAAAQANRSDAAGFAVPQSIRLAAKLQAPDVQGLQDLASAASKATMSATSTGGGDIIKNQAIADQTLRHLNRLVGESALDPEAAQQIQQFSNPLQRKASPEGVQDAQRLASHAEQYRQANTNQRQIAIDAALDTSTDEETDFELPSPEQAALAAQPLGQTAPIGRKPGQLGAMPPKTRLGNGMASALALQSQKRADQVGLERNRQDLLSDTGLSDSSILDDAGLEPVLRLYDRSYTDQQIPDVGTPMAGGNLETGGGYISSDSDMASRARQLQQAQHQSRRNFIGGNDTYFGFSPADLAALEKSAGLGGIRGQIGEDLSGLALINRSDADEDDTDEEGDEGDQARKLMSQQMAQTRQKAISDARKKLQEKVKNQIKATAKKAAQKSATAATRVTVETAQAVAGPEDAGITWLTLIIEMNLQLILKYVLKGFGFFASQAIKTDRENGIEGDIVNEMNDFANSIQTFWEDVLTIWMDCCLQIASCIQMCGPFILIIVTFLMLFGGSLFGIINGISNLGV